MDMANEKLVLSTAGSREEAGSIARALVEERLAACVNVIGPIESTYRWQGKVENTAEFLLLAKTLAAKTDSLIRRIRELHSYDVPEAIQISVEGGNADYLRWIADSV